MTAVIADPGPCLPHFPDGTVIAPPGLPENQWLQLRREGVGGSDIAALLGLDKHKGALELYLEKRGEYTRPHNPDLHRAGRRGKRLEPLVAEFFSEETGHLTVGTPGTLAHRREPWMRVNLDFMVFDPAPAVLECKTRTWRSGKAEDWTGSEPPDSPTVQACWGMAVTGWRRAYVAGLVDDDFHWWVIERDDELIGHLIQAARRFWFDHVLRGRPPAPDGLDSTKELLAHLWDVKPGSVKIFDPGEVQPQLHERHHLQQQIKQLKKRINEIEGGLRMMLGDAEIAQAPNGDPLFSCKPNGTFAHARFREELPETAKAYTRQADVLDIDRLKTEDPNLYTAYRSRVFRDGTTT